MLLSCCFFFLQNHRQKSDVDLGGDSYLIVFSRGIPEGDTESRTATSLRTLVDVANSKLTASSICHLTVTVIHLFNHIYNRHHVGWRCWCPRCDLWD